MRYLSRRAVFLLIVLGTDHTQTERQTHRPHTERQTQTDRHSVRQRAATMRYLSRRAVFLLIVLGTDHTQTHREMDIDTQRQIHTQTHRQTQCKTEGSDDEVFQ